MHLRSPQKNIIPCTYNQKINKTNIWSEKVDKEPVNRANQPTLPENPGKTLSLIIVLKQQGYDNSSTNTLKQR